MFDSNEHCCDNTPCGWQLTESKNSQFKSNICESTAAICDCEPLLPTVPRAPEKPYPNECCGNGCTSCVFDIYDEEMKIWEKECVKIQSGIVSNESNLCEGPVIVKEEYNKFELISIQKVSQDSNLYQFRLPPNQHLGLEPGQHLIMRGDVEGQFVTRQYTPITPCMCGYFDVLIKIYEHGKMSKYVKTWQKGELVEWRGPFGDFSYVTNKYRHIGMLAAGTGIAPMASVIVKILNNGEDETFITLLYACRTYKDLLLKSYLDEWSAFWNFKVVYALSQEDVNQKCRKYGERIQYGRIGKEHISNEMPPPSNDIKILVCGTSEFDQDMIAYLKELNYDPNQYFKF